MAYNELDPIGEYRADYRFSYMFSLLTNLVIRAVGKKNAKLTEVKDFLFKWDRDAEKKGQSIEEMKAILMSIARTQNKSTNKK